MVQVEQSPDGAAARDVGEKSTPEQTGREAARTEQEAEHKPADLETAVPEDGVGTPDNSEQFAVVGIGASAGGLEALQQLLRPIPTDCGMAFVVVVHLSPQHQSVMADILQSYTKMPVTQVTDMVKMRPGHVYVIPPNRNLSSIDTHLRLSPLEGDRAKRAPIDFFFRTLARSHGDKAIGVVLSGGGSDGAVGLKAIKEAGGLILAQDPEEAAFDGMPLNAIATGIIDDVLPVTEMADRLLTYVSTRPNLAPVIEGPAGEAISFGAISS